MRRALAVVAAVVAVFLVASVALAAPVRVRVKNDFYDPGSRSITRGRTVKWVNNSGDEHTITAWKGPWSKNTRLSGNGDTTSKRFRRVGVYKYRCRFHSSLSNGGRTCNGMCGRIRVTRR